MRNGRDLMSRRLTICREHSSPRGSDCTISVERELHFVRSGTEAPMLRRLRQLEDWEVRSREGDDFGKVEDFYFDDEQWTVRYVVVRTGNWFAGRSVLLSPISLDRIDAEKMCFEFSLTSHQISNAPNAEATLPISRQWEASYSSYYGFPYYWVGPRVWGFGAMPQEFRSAREIGEKPAISSEDARHIRSANEVVGYHIKAQDGEVGHVEDFLLDDHTWTIRYLLIDTSNWIGGRTVLIAPEWAEHIDWAQQQVRVDVDREAVKSSPQYDPGADLDRRYEQRLADIYHRPLRKV
jgi:sporulation protein YlmC with PRC-barrel domain